MPQMTPLMWFSLYLYVLMSMMMFLVVIYYFYLINFELVMYNFMVKFYTYKFKW